MSRTVIEVTVDFTNILLIIVGVAAIYFVGMWPVDDSVAMRMTDEAWRMESYRRFLILSACSLGISLLSLLGRLALFRIATVGSNQNAGKWALASLSIPLLFAIATIIRFSSVRPWF